MFFSNNSSTTYAHHAPQADDLLHFAVWPSHNAILPAELLERGESNVHLCCCTFDGHVEMLLQLGAGDIAQSTLDLLWVASSGAGLG